MLNLLIVIVVVIGITIGIFTKRYLFVLKIARPFLGKKKPNGYKPPIIKSDDDDPEGKLGK